VVRRAAIVLSAAGLGLLAVRYPPELTAAGMGPQWLFLLPLLAGLRAAPGRAALVGWSFGLLADLLSAEPLGLSAFLYGGAAFLLARLKTNLYSDHAVTQGVIAFGLTFLVMLLCMIRVEIVAPSFRLVAHLPAAFFSSLATAVLLPFLVMADGRLDLLRDLRAGAGIVRT